MLGDCKIKRLMKKLQYQTTEFVDYTNSLNQCAYTDAILENVLKTTGEIKQILDSRYETIK